RPFAIKLPCNLHWGCDRGNTKSQPARRTRAHARFSRTNDVAPVAWRYLAAIRRPLVVREQLGPNVHFTPESGHWLSVLECPLCAMCGRLRVGKGNLHVAALVGAAMCSACLRGSHDRWP